MRASPVLLWDGVYWDVMTKTFLLTLECCTSHMMPTHSRFSLIICSCSDLRGRIKPDTVHSDATVTLNLCLLLNILQVGDQEGKCG